ncbi:MULTISPECIES: helix-turn-helix transcriptional regulator [Streptomyces]|uniref:helix-turn-helix transcriptional regulator n=1 Tax=Streptomyces TaxID=1883 RepID=UPI00292DE05A|nr:helix-turn-helix domain-containing protein [Streptomyces sp. NEAU-HV9]
MTIVTIQGQRLDDPAQLVATVDEFLQDSEGDLIGYWNVPLDENLLLELFLGAREWTGAGTARVIYPHGALRDARLSFEAARQRERGALVGQSAWLPPGAMLLTSAGAIVTTRPESGGFTAVRDPSLLRALHSLAELLWRRAEIVPAQPEDPPTEAEQQLLRMLMEGLTDQAVARRQGTSERTVRRMAAQLMERLNAVSRFEAGVRAVERGWI